MTELKTPTMTITLEEARGLAKELRHNFIPYNNIPANNAVLRILKFVHEHSPETVKQSP